MNGSCGITCQGNTACQNATINWVDNEPQSLICKDTGDFSDSYTCDGLNSIGGSYVECTSQLGCNEATLQCPAYQDCEIRCDALFAACMGAVIYGPTQGNLNVICNEWAACASVEVECPPSGYDCIVSCLDGDGVCTNLTHSTHSPTTKPSYYPTLDPTLDPTSSPSIDPTLAPTLDPTHPSEPPSNNPTLNPTLDPTMRITSSPTMDPTMNITLNPTHPSEAPSNHPTSNPTRNPSTYPTLDPTMSITSSPTRDPTSNPSDNPTESPSVHPSQSPSFNPIFNPTLNPTEIPSVLPSIHPSQSSSAESEVISTGVVDIDVTISEPPASEANVGLYVFIGAILLGLLFCVIGILIVMRTQFAQSEMVKVAEESIQISLQMDQKFNVTPDIRPNIHQIEASTDNATTAGKTDGANNAQDEIGKMEIKRWLKHEVKLPQYYKNFHEYGFESMQFVLAIQEKSDSLSELFGIGIVDEEHQMRILSSICKLNRDEQEQGLEGKGDETVLDDEFEVIGDGETTA